jgi:hypothetical protein
MVKGSPESQASKFEADTLPLFGMQGSEEVFVSHCKGAPHTKQEAS